MGLFGIVWEVWLQPIMEWFARKWVQFVVAKPRWWTSGTPDPVVFAIEAYKAPARWLPWKLFPLRYSRSTRIWMVPHRR